MTVPSPQLLDLFDAYVSKLYRKIQVNTEQSATLAAIRDTLLPKLLAGEVRVREAEKTVEQTV